MNSPLCNPGFEEIASRLLDVRRAMLRPDVPRLAMWQERKAKQLLSDHLAGPINVGEIARCCRISRGYFISAFSASAGVTPHQWLICSRLHRAQELLMLTDLSLAEIALNCGFYDQSHFSRAFAQRTGVPPGKWRRVIRVA